MKGQFVMSDNEMWALVFDRTKDDWEGSRGLRKARVPRPVLDERENPADADDAIVKIHYTGVCGSDRGVWFRNSFKEMILGSLEEEGKDYRVIGHELFGEVVEVGSDVAATYGIDVGATVSAESHITCGRCKQCLRGDRHVCDNAKIIGFARDGCFAEFIKLPANVLWPTNVGKIDGMVAAIQEPFGNAVHAATTVDLRDKSVAIFGTGSIGLFTILTTRALGASRIIGIEPNEKNAALAERMGVDEMVRFEPDKTSWRNHPDVVKRVRDFGGGNGVDVAFEMAGFNSSVNNAIHSVDQGADVVLFGLKSGDFTIQDFSEIVVRGLSLHAVIGRRIFETWEMTRKLLESKENGIHDKLLNIILNGGDDTVVHIDDYEAEDFEKRIVTHPKVLIQWCP
jgi:threonine 3-dehydrogenase